MKNNNRHYLITGASIGVVLLAFGWFSWNKDNQMASQSTTSPTNALDRSDLSFDIPYWHNGSLYVASVIERTSIKLGEIDVQLLPPVITYDTFVVSPQRTFVAWYTPDKGIYAAGLSGDFNPTLIYQTGSWFTVNAYFAFHPKEDYLFVMSNEGKSLSKIDLHTLEEIHQDIPFPYGTVFRISPEAGYVIFVSGFRQAESNPTYLVTTIDGTLIDQFETDAELPNRYDLVFVDEVTFYLRGENDQLLEGVIQAGGVVLSEIHGLPEGQFDRFIPSGNGLLLSSRRSLTYYDKELKTGREILPDSLFDGMGSYDIYPYDAQHFIAIEYFRQNEKRFDRLWTIDMRGSKRILAPSFNEAVVIDMVQDLE